MKTVLYYIHDPMCSWCYGFQNVWTQVQQMLVQQVKIQYVLGGLAKDNDEIMPVETQLYIQKNWQRIQQVIPNTKFNYNFWKVCKPRRSTYPSCRAVITARLQGEQFEKKMVDAIQQAYYLNAKNPSNDEVLIQLAKEIGLDTKRFITELNSDKCNFLLKKDLQLVTALQANGFPSLVLQINSSLFRINVDYNDESTIVSSVLGIIESNLE